ncbi:MAG: NAD(P)-binding domain-containing protein, partial [Bacteroidetes bacterium]|nr:NAD(P)-binding domain-containing protein [Bacteroidota bacterium]
IGFGNIGQAAAKIAFAFGMQVLVSTRTPEKYQQWMSYSENKISFVSQEEVFRKSDVVSIHCPLTEATKNLVNEKTLSQMKPSAFLINTSRGGVIDEQALADALNQEKIAGAGLDVLSKEPPPLTNPLLSAKNCVITPHIAWAALAARERLITAAIENLKAFLNGAPVNVVNK